ncbi:MAG: hypothetical protein JW786_02880 [Desulfobacterales bacterium]|nr:hypothetical protein [Desulfobacterales bacterium]
MEKSFDKLKEIARDFYRGWKWSTEHVYTRTEYECFVNQVEEPLNCEIAKLLAQGVSMHEIEKKMDAIRQEVWPELIEAAHQKNR